MLYNEKYLNIMMIQGSKGYAFHACMKKHDLLTRKTPKSIIISQLDGIWQRAFDFVRMQIVISVDSPAGLQCVCRQL